MGWFKEWFNSYYYHLLYKDRNESEAQQFLDNLISSTYLKKRNQIIDIACGKGRHAIYLNQKGFDVTGIDLSTENIKEAKKAENSNLRFEVMDMRNVFIPNNFDVVLNLFTSFGYFDDERENKKAIHSMSSHLNENGILILDYMNCSKIIPNLIEYEIKTVEEIDFHIKRFIEHDAIMKRISFKDKGQTYCYFERVKIIEKEDFLNYFSEVGLEILDIFGDYSLSPYDKDTSDRLIIIAQKKNG